MKRGTLVDATIIAAAVKPPSFEEGVVSERDPDASFTVKNDETSFGYKAHLAVDEESGLVRQAEMTSADLHDSQRGEAMIQGDEAAYYADKAYDSQALRDKLGELGIEDRIAYKAKRNKPLVNWQVWFNKTASRIRVGVERANATMKNWYGMAKVRYLGLDRNNCNSVRRDGDEHQAGEASHRGAVPLGKDLCGIAKRSENERLRTLKIARDKAYTFVAALLRRSKNRTAPNLDHYAKRSNWYVSGRCTLSPSERALLRGRPRRCSSHFLP